MWGCPGALLRNFPTCESSDAAPQLDPRLAHGIIHATPSCGPSSMRSNESSLVEISALLIDRRDPDVASAHHGARSSGGDDILYLHRLGRHAPETAGRPRVGIGALSKPRSTSRSHQARGRRRHDPIFENCCDRRRRWPGGASRLAAAGQLAVALDAASTRDPPPGSPVLRSGAATPVRQGRHISRRGPRADPSRPHVRRTRRDLQNPPLMAWMSYPGGHGDPTTESPWAPVHSSGLRQRFEQDPSTPAASRGRPRRATRGQAPMAQGWPWADEDARVV